MVCCWSACKDQDAALHKKPEIWESTSVLAQALISGPGGEEEPGESRSACTHGHCRSVFFLNESIFKAEPRAVISIQQVTVAFQSNFHVYRTDLKVLCENM